ncbi:hypothetical protein [Proteiniclasticum ruminis]|uniref:Uncharacterized protein n=1 Tax=Proteiniclasticum ruminis TaxID=398199 RepID=A0A1G8HCH4_9CLOT|nr:hypothetical protein [Proteiniclasticum ruminis]SDI04366.1 hypothetical protein SAMN05421804_101541 [Proteiniclasticum ruminis]
MKNVKCEICVIEMHFSPSRKQPYPPTLEVELRRIFNFASKLDHNVKKTINNTEKIAYYLNKHKEVKTPSFIHVDMCSGKFNRRRVVKNMLTNENKGVLKEEPDADEEHTYASLYFPDQNTCYCAFESNYDGIGISKFINYINHISNLYVKELNGKTRFYKFEYRMLVNRDFLTELSKMKKISMAKIIVDSNELTDTEFKVNRSDVREEVELIYKPSSRGVSIGRDFVKRLEKLKKKGTVKRVIANGDIGLSKVRIDTEEMKTKEEISVDVNHLGEVKWNSIKAIFERKLLEYVTVEIDSEEYQESEDFSYEEEYEYTEKIQTEI